LLNSMIAAYGQWGLLIVMFVQTIIAPIPSEALLVFAGALGIGLFDIVLFGGVGLLLGSIAAFYIGRIGGRPVVEKMLGKKWMGRVDGWVTKNGAKAILLTRLTPFVPFDLISYISGATSLSFRSYIVATVLGAFPRCLFLAFLGTIAKDVLMLIGIGLELTFIAGIAGLVVIAYLDNKGYLAAIGNSMLARLIRKTSDASTAEAEATVKIAERK